MTLEEKDGPFGNAALAYIKAGWPEVLPVWRGGHRDKQPMVRGYHGREGAWPDKTTTQLWSGRYARANIALRLPRWVIGLDVDHYDKKRGGDTLDDLEQELGLLPTCPVSTSRDDGISGIRLFALPGDYAGADWPSQAGEDIEVITWYERYVICYPSIHKTGNKYWWRKDVDGNMLSYGRPKPERLPTLPENWCEYLAGLARRGSDKWNGASYDGSAAEWLVEYGGGEECDYVLEYRDRWVDGLSNGGSAHEAAKLAVAQAIKAAAEGHRGINNALWDVRTAFITAVGNRTGAERRRGEGKAVQEWRSMVSGAVAKYGGDVADDDLCEELEGF
jgi:hypothetical protein